MAQLAEHTQQAETIPEGTRRRKVSLVGSEVTGSSPVTATQTNKPKQKNMKKKLNEWMGKKNVAFSAITGEEFTNFDVVITHVVLIVFLFALGIAGSIDAAY